MKRTQFKLFLELLARVFILPTSAKVDHESQRRTIAISSITLSYIIFLFPLWCYLRFGRDLVHESHILAGSLFLHTICYALSRSGRYLVGGFLLSLTITIGVLAAIYDNLNKPEATLIAASATVYFSLALQLAGFLGSWRQVVGVLAVILVSITYLFPRLPNYDVVILFSLYTSFSVIAVMGLVAHKLRQLDIQFMSEERLKTAHRSRLASLAEMSSGISHEINNPLTIIEGFANQIISMAKRGQSETAKNIYLAEKIVENSERISKIIRGLRSFAREGDKEPFAQASIAKILSDTLDFCKARFKNHGIELTCAAIDPGLKIDCRPVQIAQIFLNLLYNSFDAVKAIETRWIRVDVVEESHFVSISFTDSGPGILPAVKEKIFEPFFTTKDIGNGAGLGLSICISLTREHGGEIQLDEDCPNTRFVIKLPKVINQAAIIAA